MEVLTTLRKIHVISRQHSHTVYIALYFKKMKFSIFLILCLLILQPGFSQPDDKEVIRQIFDNALLSDAASQNLKYLCNQTPGRILGSDASLKALNFMKEYVEQLGADTVFLQEFVSPAWLCQNTSVHILNEDKALELHADALGPSPSTPASGLIAEVIEVQGLEELKKIPREEIRNKIVFFNRPVDHTKINTFSAYSSAIDQRYRGPALAAALEASGVLVRSVSTKTDTFPHTGSTSFDTQRIPCAAISTSDADLLSDALQKNNKLQLKMVIDAVELKEVKTYNLIADLYGSKYPDEFLIVGGHIDAWFNSPGAHDDGAGCVQSADVLRIFKELEINHKRSLRLILFMDEELYQSGGAAYAQYTIDHQVKNYIALEADAGGFTPVGFTVDAHDSIVQMVAGFQKLLEPYGIYYIKKGGSGVDISPLKDFGVPLLGYRTDSQRYMDIHHSANDGFEKVHFRELQLGSGCMASMIYLLDKYELGAIPAE